ncbi:hypothetical protein NHX12_029466 [Muraenolepis orangiensis]|uniref:BACK domain-containing protein n=1 Tax=Muraenolepis orangiensis TaxID=630683 RepID=A0A9Q0EHS7_9TELE|nr:hypothetical protein NHX12_029466 [Muraenolepis orangiensis]
MADDASPKPSPLAVPAGASGHPSRHTYTSSGHLGSLLGGLHDLRRNGVLGMFAGGLREAQQTEIPVHGVTYLAVSKLLDFIYTSDIELDLDNVQEVLFAATLVQLEDVIGFCCDFLYYCLDESNILEVHKLANMFGLKQLEAKVHSYILRNIQTLSRAEVYRQLPEEEVLRVLSSEELEVLSEKEVYEAALHYHYSPEQVETDQVCLQDNLRMLEAVRFCLMEKPVLQRFYSKLVDPCPLKESVAWALRYHDQELLQPVLQGPLTQPRSNYRCILAFGGMHASSSAPDTEAAKGSLFQVFHPGWGEWRKLPAAQAPHMSNQGVAVLNNFVYLVGGDKNTGSFSAETCCWRYDPRHNRWCSIKPLRRQHADHCVCVLGEHIYAVGGRDYSHEMDSVERYDPHTDTWEYVAPLKRKVYAHAGAVLDGKMYVTCGRRRSAYLRETYSFDPATECWEACSDGPVERAWHGAATLNGRLYVIGGTNDEHCLSHLYIHFQPSNGDRLCADVDCDDPPLCLSRTVLQVACFNPAYDSWSLVSPLPVGHGEPGVAVLDGRLYVLGGLSHDRGDRGNRTRYVNVYDPEADRWEAGTPFEGHVSGLAACVLPLPLAVLGQARGWPHRCAPKRAFWEEEVDDDDMHNSGYSSED